MMRLRPMTEEEFGPYRAALVESYAQDNVRSERWKQEDALELSDKEINELLPQGLATKDHYLFFVEDDGIRVGALWFAVITVRTNRDIYIYDIQTFEPYRRRGYATKTLELLEQKVVELGLDIIRLHVLAHNTGAIALYNKVGFRTTNIRMLKRVIPSAQR